jgi:hypothetical protein
MLSSIPHQFGAMVCLSRVWAHIRGKGKAYLSLRVDGSRALADGPATADTEGQLAADAAVLVVVEDAGALRALGVDVCDCSVGAEVGGAGLGGGEEGEDG